MTAEIIVKNPVACALAADSAMTMTGGNSGTVKIFNNAEKIYQLSKHYPVGLMVYNNADFCGTPWELSIRSFRKLHGHEEHSTIRDYLTSFLNFLNSTYDITSIAKRESKLREMFRRYLRLNYDDLSQKTLHVSLPESDDEALNIIHQRLTNFYASENEFLERNPFFEGFDESDIIDAREFVINNYLQIALDIFPNNGDLPEHLKTQLINFFTFIICKENVTSLYSGLVFAGFGSDEYYASIITIQIYGSFNNKVMYKIINGKCSKSDPDNSVIIPFASEDEVFTFVRGFNNSIINFMGNTVSQLSNVILENLRERGVSDEISEQKLASLKDDIIDRVQRYCDENFTQKVTNMLTSLSKKDLSYMAESLVNLSAFKLKISDSYETVGGPIDVAIISKTDGFVWIKRKLYFDKNLNNN
ncbi:TPA: hypothetical protein SLO68_003198 [Klebsiella pneumoniae]|nr:hypothetical protein [Klebsiella pneumoniae]DAL51674.1 MAG TPA_asm: hypothetical protein [Caudoviricetes sp.]HBW1981298.1 hypothetical protein [Klebsiella quasipneumoniae subsp. similipneumoniae]HCM6425400.1 hypothetical protein [Klebsiella quasipneumoniae]EIW8626765.1 hypothetical protein [Klebsiella pneumoniae]EKU8658023.1 hypothetical protein [Klebsiella pneumoniae]